MYKAYGRKGQIRKRQGHVLYEQTVQDKDIQAKIKILNFLALDMETKTLVKFKH